MSSSSSFFEGGGYLASSSAASLSTTDPQVLRAFDLVAAAKNGEREGDFKKAYQLYQDAIRAYCVLLSKAPTNERREVIQRQISGCVDRAEALSAVTGDHFEGIEALRSRVLGAADDNASSVQALGDFFAPPGVHQNNSSSPQQTETTTSRRRPGPRRTMSTIVDDAFNVDAVAESVKTISFDKYASSWIECKDAASGHTYWFNSVTKESSWDPPTLAPPPPPSKTSAEAEAEAALKKAKEEEAMSTPDGWVQYVDDATNQPYWYSIVTGESSWTKPEAAKKAKPAIPPRPALPPRPKSWSAKQRAPVAATIAALQPRKPAKPAPKVAPRPRPSSVRFSATSSSPSTATANRDAHVRARRAQSVRLTASSSKSADGMAHQRRMAIEEIYATEHVYVDHITILYEAYVKGFDLASSDDTLLAVYSMKTDGYKPEEVRSRTNALVLKCAGVAECFRSSGIRNLHMLNTRLKSELRTLVEAIDRNDAAAESLGELFSKFIPFLKMYKQYSLQFPVLSEEINKGLKSTPGFMDLVNELQYKRAEVIKNDNMRKARSSPFGKLCTDISSLLIQPIQRIPRYLMLIESVLKNTPASHPDRSMLEKCLKQIADVATEINTALMNKQRQMKVLEIQRRFKPPLDKPLVTATRYFVREASMRKACRQRVRGTKPYIFFLFSDVLVYADKIMKGNLRHHKTITFTQVSKVSAALSSKGYSFEVLSPEKPIIIVASTEEERASWMKSIQDLLDDRMSRRRSFEAARSPKPSSSMTPSAIAALTNSYIEGIPLRGLQDDQRDREREASGGARVGKLLDF